VRTADQRFSIEGTGWSWDLSGSVLTISNNVVALVRKAALAGATNSTETNLIRITSTRFQQDGDAAKFFGSVLVRDGDDTVRCERLDIQFVKPGGAQKIEAVQNVEIHQGDTEIRSGRALYDVKENIIRISERPTWLASQREGSADLLVMNRAQDSLSATGHVYMKLPLTNLVLSGESTVSGNPGTNRFVEIRSERFDYQNAQSNQLATALYRGAVRAVQRDATLACERLTVDFGASNRVAHLHAEQQVEMVSEKTRVFGGVADYDLESDKLTVQQEPRWEVDQTRGRSESLVFFPKTKEMLATNRVEVTLPGHSLGGLFAMPGQTNQPAPTNSPLTITAESLKRATNVSVFEKQVQIADARGTISCSRLTVFSGQTNQTDRIIAEEHVIIKQPNMVAYGDRAEYEQSTGLVRLTGNPELIGQGRHLRAETFIIDRNRNSFSVSPGKFRIELELSKGVKTP
jgi:lipopolysaccharide export system protein LptA